MLSSAGSAACVGAIIGGKVVSVVVDVVVVLSGCLFVLLGTPKPATATESFAVDLRFLASMGDSDLLKAPAVNER